ncbi:hypothetical protein BH24CHL6_BH24CHL6_05010 [soil metagenome]
MLVIVYWVTEAIPVPATALLGPALCAFLGVAPTTQVLAGFASPTIFLSIGSFVLARAMSIHGLDRRFALRILSIPRIAGSTYGTLIAFGLVAALTSAFISNTAATAMLLPIGIGIVAIYGGLIHADSPEHDPGTANLGAALMLMTAYAASVGIVVPIVISLANAAGIDPAVPGLAAVFGVSFGFMLPVSTPPNAIVYGSGMVPIRCMVRSGFVFDIVGALVIAVGVTLWAGVVGLR